MDKRLDNEMLFSRVNFGMERISVNRLETYAEFSDGIKIVALSALNKSTNSANVLFIEWQTKVCNLQVVVEEGKLYRS